MIVASLKDNHNQPIPINNEHELAHLYLCGLQQTPWLQHLQLEHGCDSHNIVQSILLRAKPQRAGIFGEEGCEEQVAVLQHGTVD